MPAVEFHELSDPGRVAATNGDAVGHWPHEDGLVFAVARGIGGQQASTLALDVLGREIVNAPEAWDVRKRLRRAMQAANLDLYNKAITVPELRGMSTTLTVSALVGGTLFVVHVGNTRLFLWRDRELVQLTKDHSLDHSSGWDELGGGASSGGAHADPRSHTLTRCLGLGVVVAIDALTLALRAGDVLLQCSDGIHGVLGEQEMGELLAAHPPAPACRALVRRAREEGGENHLSVQVASVVSCPPAGHAWWRLGL